MATEPASSEQIGRDDSSTMHNQGATTRPTERIPKEASDSSDDMDVDEMFKLLSNRRRRSLLYYLWDNGGGAHLGTVAEQIAAWENDTDVTEVTASDRKAVYTALQQFHLPKLEEFGVVEFDQRDGYIELGTEAENIQCFLDGLATENDSGESTVDVTTLGLVAAGSLSLGFVLGMAGVPPLLVTGSGLVLLVLVYAFVRYVGESPTEALSGPGRRAG